MFQTDALTKANVVNISPRFAVSRGCVQRPLVKNLVRFFIHGTGLQFYLKGLERSMAKGPTVEGGGCCVP